MAPPSFTARRASACAASTYTGSFNVTNACNGVFVRLRRTTQTSRFGASNVLIAGYGLDRRHSVYNPRRYLSSPGLGCQSIDPPNAALIPSAGCGGFTDGPNIFGDNSPLAASAWSRTISAVSRNRGPRASNRLSGSRSAISFVTFDDCR